MNTVGLIIYPASDVPKATKFFATLLGTEPYAEAPYYVGFKAGDMEIGLVPKAAHRGLGAIRVRDGQRYKRGAGDDSLQPERKRFRRSPMSPTDSWSQPSRIPTERTSAFVSSRLVCKPRAFSAGAKPAYHRIRYKSEGEMTLHSARLFSLLVGALALSACAGNGTGSPARTNPLIPAEPNAGRAAHGTSWMARDATTHDLLYVSNRQGGSVYVYSYPEGKLKGWLQNLHANGLCSDSNGDVFIPDGNEIREYGHGGTRPIAVLHDPLGGVAQFCAVDPIPETSPSPEAPRSNGVAIYANAAGSPKYTAMATSVLVVHV